MSVIIVPSQSVPSPVRMTIGTNASYTSTVVIPINNVVSSIFVNILSAYSAGATIAVTCNGQTLMSTTNNNPQVIELYEFLTDVVISAASIITVTINGSPSAGSGTVIVNYSFPSR